MPVRYTEEQKQWIRDNFDSTVNIRKLWLKFNKYFGTDYSLQQIRNQVHYLGLRRDFFWTKEEDQWLIDNYEHLGATRALPEYEKVFGNVRTRQSISAHAHILGLTVNEDAKSQIAGDFRRVPIGTITEDKDGYLRIKTGKGVSGWELLYRYIWECYNGPVPKGYCIFLIDGNRKNNRIDNMMLITQATNAVMNKNKWNCEDRDIAMSGIAYCKLKEAIKEKRSENE